MRSARLCLAIMLQGRQRVGKKNEMLILYQRYHTHFNLLLLVLIGVAAGLLAGSLLEISLDMGPTTTRAASPEDQTEARTITQADLDQILQGNIFDPAGRRDGVSFSPGSVAAAGDNIGETEAAARQPRDLNLLGTVVAGEQSLALIQVERESDIYHLEDSLPGDLVLAEILRSQVQLRHPDGSLTTLMLTEDEPDKARRPRARASSAAVSGDEIRQVDDNSWLVSRETVEKTRENLAEELRLAQMQPRVVNGQTDGFLVRMIKRRSILNKLGLRRGDVVMNINNIELDSPEKALQIFQQLREARQIDVAIERRGEAMNFSYQLD